MAIEGVESSPLGMLDMGCERDNNEDARAKSVEIKPGPRGSMSAGSPATCSVCGAVVGNFTRVHFANCAAARPCEGSWPSSKKAVTK